ncbi:hypothetical protein [Clostridium sp. 'White wine YQ']|uniref:hypothetical protein n=1 Tax=Clostridium sp. 'White wine YQ' TaxID=3027474 RepID=UPI0023659EA8|nr:hypothetical protein [Clostridium sp. 'White wine YQ']MDD7793074.1 hypothetical protein [Clostridium sp. 'White wine YQ']
MININNGNISINDGRFIITKSLTKNGFMNSNLYNDVISQQTHMFSNYYLKPQLIGKDKFIMTLVFNPSDMIYLVNICLSNEGDKPTWDNWSQYEVLKIKNKNDEWLEKNIGKPPYKYSWGEISSNYDPRSGSSMISIRYDI